MKEGTLGVTEMQEFIQQTAIQFPNDKLKVCCAISQCGKMKNSLLPGINFLKCVLFEKSSKIL